jgi:hypothetical protein
VADIRLPCRGLVARLAVASAGVLLAVAALSGPALARSTPLSAMPAISPRTATSYSVHGLLGGVAALSVNNAWAVGETVTANSSRTLILHWNGSKWSPVTNPKPITGGLIAISAESAHDIWAVGFDGSQGEYFLVMHWNGKAWSRQAIPEVNGALDGVAAAGNTVWAVGDSVGEAAFQSVAVSLRLTGGNWSLIPVQVSVPSYLTAVTVTSAGTVWAAGELTGKKYENAVLRWNGKSWVTVQLSLPSHPSYSPSWGGLASGRGGAAFLVGNIEAGYSMRWTGKTWQRTPIPLKNADLDGVSYIPGGTAWAVGNTYETTALRDSGLILHWSGSSWVTAANPPPVIATDGYYLQNVSASSRDNAWAVGEVEPYNAAGLPTTWIMHWNGKTWS